MPLCARCKKRYMPNEGELCWECQLEAWKEEVEMMAAYLEDVDNENNSSYQ